MKDMKGVAITGKNTLEISEHCPLPEEISALARAIWECGHSWF